MSYPAEHTANIIDPAADRIRVRRTRGSGTRKVNGVTVPPAISVIWFIQDDGSGGEKLTPQSLRFPVSEWTEEHAKQWLAGARSRLKTDPLEAAPVKGSEASTPCYQYYVDKTKGQLDILLHDEVGFWGTQSKEFHELLAENKDVGTIALDINSPGGSVFDGFSIYNALKSHGARVEVKISGVAASIASVIAMAGDSIEMPETSLMMIHKPYVPGLAGADADKLRSTAEALDKMETGIISAYKTRIDKSEAEIAKMLSATTWFTASEARDLGIADKVTGASDVLNYFDFTSYEYGELPAAVNKFDISRDDPIEDLQDPPANRNDFQKLIDLIKKHFHLKKESDTMADKDLQSQIDALATENADLKASNKELTEKNETLSSTIQTQLASIEATAKATRAAEYKSFCDKLVTEGKIKPADVETHVDTMELKYQSDITDEKNNGETPSLDGYKKVLDSLPVSVPVGDRHVADKDRVEDKDTQLDSDPLDEAARKIVADYKSKGLTISYRDAVQEAYSKDPNLYKVA